MIKRFKRWLYRFLPAWAVADLKEANRKLIEQNDALRHQIRERDLYIQGLETGMRSQRKIVINTQGEVKE